MDGECRRGSGGGLLPTASDLQYLPTLYLILLIHINIDIFLRPQVTDFYLRWA